MRNSIWALFALACATTRCGGQTSSNPTSNGGASFTWCDRLRESLESSACRAAADPRVVDDAYDECAARYAGGPTACAPPLERLYACLVAAGTACPGSGPDCSDESRGYAECASGGSCHDVGGGQARSSTPDTPISSFTNHELCQCIAEPWHAGAAGTACRTWEDCEPVCCSCSDSTSEYTAAVCEVDAADGIGTCATTDHACTLTRDRCELRRVRQTP